MKLDVKVPSPGESITEVQISQWLKQDGDFVEKDEEIAEIDSDKATLTIAAEQTGTLKILISEGETVSVGTVVCTIDTEGVAPAKENKQPVAEAAKPAKQEETKQAAAPVTEVSKASVKKAGSYAEGVASPAAEKLMKENNINAQQVSPSGKDGRITKGDVLEAGKFTSAPVEAKPVTTATPGARTQRREKMTMLRKKLSQRLVAVKNETAMLTTFNEVDMSGIMEIRKQYKDKFKEKHGTGLGLMSFFTKAVCIALREFPAVNGMIDGEEIVFHDYCDIGIAVSAPKGLMVPVMRNAEKLSMAEIESQVMLLATRARDGKITVDEMTGGTFTITNGGVFGSMLSTPILNPPQSAILGMHNIVERPVAVNGKVEIRPIMYVALSYDHRIIDGRESVSFLVKVKQMLENPALLFSEGKDPVKGLLGI
jgi:2-oxoglutarate dehydrogenase E2 component (dihydrolipoamide succinyltransferase)